MGHCHWGVGVSKCICSVGVEVMSIDFIAILLTVSLKQGGQNFNTFLMFTCSAYKLEPDQVYW